MEQIINVETSHLALANAGQVLTTKGIGSCIVVCIYDKVQKRGVLVHSMLPHAELDVENPFRFVDTALPLALQRLQAASPDNLAAHLVGGASMFPDLEDHLRLGEQNIAAAERVLAAHNVYIKSRAVGGSIGRSVKFFMDSGNVEVYTK